jgi:integrase
MKRNAGSYETAHSMQMLLSHLYKIAIKKEIIHMNKMDYVDSPFQKPIPKRQVWTESEIKSFWDDLPGHPFTAYILISCYTGLRHGELYKIKQEDIHLDENYMIGGIKSEAGKNRQIPIPDRIKPLIAGIATKNAKTLIDIPQNRFYNLYRETIERTGVRPLPFHTCRHYFFSRLTAAGVHSGIITEIGGHASYVTTLKNYVRIPLEDKLSAVNKI